MEKKVTKMLIKVDLQCWKCYRKIKKVLCEFPQIRDQIYDEKQNTVMITVVCCSPEKIKQKICCKAGDIILGIEIIPDKPKGPPAPPPKPPQPATKPPPPPKVPEPAPPPKVPELAPPKAPGPCRPMPQPAGYIPLYGIGICRCPPCYMGHGPCQHGCGRPPRMCYDGCGRPADECQGRNPMCYDGCGRPADKCQGGNPMCYDGCGRPAYECQGGNPMCYDGCGRPAYECQGRNRNYYVSPCDYFNEENPSGCTIM